jgi:hypothetical protein
MHNNVNIAQQRPDSKVIAHPNGLAATESISILVQISIGLLGLLRKVLHSFGITDFVASALEEQKPTSFTFSRWHDSPVTINGHRSLQAGWIYCFPFACVDHLGSLVARQRRNKARMDLKSQLPANSTIYRFGNSSIGAQCTGGVIIHSLGGF